jgi:AbrB family looped-hinge helix DNA binding protein
MPRKRALRGGTQYLPRERRGSKVAEAAVKYNVEEVPAVTTISSKNQITLPAHILREMGLAPGDRLAVGREGNRLVLRPRPRDWVRHYAGSLGGLYGATREEADAYLKDLRTEDARSAELERAWAAGTGRAQE